MPISGDALKIIRDLLYDNWSINNPSKTSIKNTGFAVVPRNKQMDGLAVTVHRETRKDMALSIGSNPDRLVADYVIITVWTTDKAQKDSMLKESRRIIRQAKATPPSGILDLESESGRPRDSYTGQPTIHAETVRVKLIYEED